MPFSKGDLYLLLFDFLFEMLHMVYTFLLFIKFQNFNMNPYFEDTKLKKTFMFFDEGSNQIWIFFVSPNWKMVNWCPIF